MTYDIAARGKQHRVSVLVGFYGIDYPAQIIDKNIRSQNADGFAVFLYTHRAGDHLPIGLNIGVRLGDDRLRGLGSGFIPASRGRVVVRGRLISTAEDY